MRRYFFAIVVIVALLKAWQLILPSGYAQKKNAESNPDPNIIFILLDAARADHFSCYGYGKNTTPCIDSISRRGALFFQNYSLGPNTFIALPGIFYSRYFSKPFFEMDSWRWGTKLEEPEGIFKKFDDQQILLTEILASQSYRTVLFHNHAWFVKEAYFTQKFDETFPFSVSEKKPMDESIISRVISWIEQHRGEKFFVYCHIMSPHQPYPPKEEDTDFVEADELPHLGRIRLKHRNKTSFHAKGWSKGELRYLRALYDSNLKHTDKWIGVLYNKLIEFGLEGKTLVIIASDHGECLGEHNFLAHGDVYWDCLLHVPLIMVYPPLIPPKTKVKGLTEAVDIMPTILDICGIKLPPGKSMDGISLLPFIKNPTSGKEIVFTRKSVRTRKYKYMNGYGLFDVVTDPGETEDIAKRTPQIRKKLRVLYDSVKLPFQRRYENASREGSPDYPFYYSIHHFQLDPGDSFTRCNEATNNISFLREKHSPKSWLFNTYPHNAGLFHFPADSPSPPINLTTRIPNGKYRVLVLVETHPELPSFLEETGFSFRYNQKKPFSRPKEACWWKKCLEESFSPILIWEKWL